MESPLWDFSLPALSSQTYSLEKAEKLPPSEARIVLELIECILIFTCGFP